MTLAIHGGSRAVSFGEPHFPWPAIGPAQEKAVLDQLRKSISIYDRSGVFEEFENLFARDHQSKHALLTNSGTTALFSIYFGLNLQPGDNVVVPDYTFFATVTPLLFFPVDIRFCDCDLSGNVDPSRLPELIDSRTRAVVITHMWGMPADMAAIAQICSENNIPIIEDCSHAHGAEYLGQRVGTFGAAAAWSLQGQKLVTGGEGGILTTNSDQLFFEGLLLGHYNKRCKSEIAESFPGYPIWETGFGLKLRAHPLSVALALSLYRQLPETLRFRRRAASKALQSLTKFSFFRLPIDGRCSPSWYAFTMIFDAESQTGIDPDRFIKAIREEGASGVERPGATRDCSQYPVFQNWTDHRIAARSSNAGQNRPFAQIYRHRAIKVPLPSAADEEPLFDQYLAAICKVSDFVANGGAI